MVEYAWPTKDKATAIGTRVKRLDGPEKSTGRAKYSYDIYPKNVLIAKGLGCPHAHCKITSIEVILAWACGQPSPLAMSWFLRLMS